MMGSSLCWYDGNMECCLCCMLMMNQSSSCRVVEGSREELLLLQTRMAHAVGGDVDGNYASFLLPNGGCWQVIMKGKNYYWKSKKKDCVFVAQAMHHRLYIDPYSH